MKYVLIFFCFSASTYGNAQSIDNGTAKTAQIVLDMNHFPTVKDGVMTIGYKYPNCDNSFKKPCILTVTVCDSALFQPCTFYSETIKTDSIIPAQITWTLNKIPISLCGTLLVTASITDMDEEPLLKPFTMKVFMTCYLPKKDSVQVIEK